ncbi:O-antigen ligase family protein [Inhella sp.]|uniref:O-antigen ligase family protein n=1 Tax=Inhella sp. TaxID=1921806 RepID=UPI0035B0AD52
MKLDLLSGVAAGLAAWVLFLPIGLKYPLLLILLGWSIWRLGATGLAQLLRQDRPLQAALLFWLGCLVSSAWSSAPQKQIVNQLGQYSLLLLAPVLAHGLPGPWARRLLAHLCAACALLGACVAWGAVFGMPGAGSGIWVTTFEADGNARILTSLLLAIGCALAIDQALCSSTPRTRWAWALAGLLALLGVVLQDRRSGMVVLPLLLGLLGWQRLPSLRLRLGFVAAFLAACTLAWQAAPGVRARFAEGLHELQHYQLDPTAPTSWGLRVLMIETSVAMIKEKPLLGHGLASWQGEWFQRVPHTHYLLIENSTPHNDYLLVLAQGGVFGLALLLGWWWVVLRQSWRAGPGSHAALLVWAAMAAAGLFNVILRDGRFAVPLLMLAALAWASRNAAQARPAA